MTDIDNLLNQSVEIESLLRLLRDRDSLEARALLGQKVDAYLGAVKAFLAAPPGHDAPQAEAAETSGREVLAQAHAVEVKDQEAVEPEDRTEADLAEAAVAREETASAAAEIPAEAPVEAPKARPLAESRPRDHAARNLAKAFTLNERFRFIREVFGGDAVDFENTLHVLEDFDSPDEVADYIYNEMMLDPADRAVADFVTLVQNHIRN